MIRNQKGMTLIEIMIVLAIVGGLMAVLSNTIGDALNKSRVKQAQIQIRELGKALDIYYADCNTYPTTDQGLKALMQSPGEDACTNWGPEAYLKKEPKDPWGQTFSYDSDGTQYSLKSYGKDKKEGGEGYNKDIDSAQL